ncbi:MAG: NAD(P)/FAD-dependent oxidoreductase [Acidimicrobiales bacterium]
MSEPLRDTDAVVVVGAGLAGWRLSEALRRRGFAGSLTLVGAEPDRPYDRPPLSKQVLAGTLEESELSLERGDEASTMTWRLGTPATSLDVAARRVILADGEVVEGSRIVIATGVRARRLAVSAGERVHYVRALPDVRRLLADLARARPGGPVVVIGGGFIGAEVATSLAHRGYPVVVLEALERPLLTVLGPTVSQWLLDLPSQAGIELRTSCGVRDVVSEGDDLVVELVDGTTLRTSTVVAGVGAEPSTEWLVGADVTLDNGVVVDDEFAAAPDVAAIGDVARFPWLGPTGVELTRIEHWQVANDHAAELARLWTGFAGARPPLIPYFWSDQYGAKVQVLGHPRPTDDVRAVVGEPGGARWLALYSRDEVVSGVVALRSPRALTLSRSLLAAPTALGDALAQAPWAR